MRLNTVIFSGRIFSVGPLKQVGEHQVCDIRMSQSRVKGKNRDGTPQFHNDWVTVTAWNKSAEIAQNLERSDRVVVEGGLVYEEWESDQKGKQSQLKIKARYIHKTQGVDEPSTNVATSSSPQGSSTDDVPF